MRWTHAWVPLTALVLASVACTRDPLERTVSVPTMSRFNSWRANVASDSGAETRRQVELALQEIRSAITGEREMKRRLEQPVEGGLDTVDEQIRLRVDGHLLREVVQSGYELRQRRLKEELAGLEDAMAKNAQLVTRPGDYESKQHLEGVRDRQMVRVENYRADLATTERELAPLRAKTGRSLLVVSGDRMDQK